VRRIAVGAAPGTRSLQVAGNADSSSLLPMLDAHTPAAPHTATVGEVEVEVTTVDDLLDANARPEDRVLLKLDVQGAESAVLDGTTLERITAIHLEHSLVELYAGSATFDALHGRLRDAGFRLVDVSPEFRDPRNSQLLQFDATYLRDADDRPVGVQPSIAALYSSSNPRTTASNENLDDASENACRASVADAAGSSSRDTTAAAIASGDPTSTRRPDVPPSRTHGTAPASRPATTGVPAAIASRITWPNVSSNDGWTRSDPPPRKVATSPTGSGPTKSTPAPSPRSADHRAAGPSGW